jgi:glycosyltransferase involved in cell wall biosynthesis
MKLMDIYFIFPYRGVGGVSLLFLRFAEYLTKNKLANCMLVDYSDGYMAKNVNSQEIQILSYHDDVPVCIPSGSVAIFQSMTPWSIFPSLKISDDVRVLFWNCYPFNLIPLLPGIRRQMQENLSLTRFVYKFLLRTFYNKCRQFTEYIFNTNALVFMDVVNVKTTSKFLSIELKDPLYVPVAIAATNHLSVFRESKNDLRKVVRVAWVGRVVDFKYYSLIHALETLNESADKLDLSFEIKIVGSGDYESKLKQEAFKLSKLELVFIKNIVPSELDEFLVNEVDLLLAMGTSALEGAKLGVPTILLDISFSPISRDYCFKWLYQQDGYTLGNLVDDTEMRPNNFSLEELIAQLQSDFSGVSERTLNYFMSHHEIGNSSAQLLEVLKRTVCTYGQLREYGFLSRGLLYSTFFKFKKRISLL